jgi:hypothetical protein
MPVPYSGTIHAGRTHAFTELRRRKVADRVSLDGIVLTARWEEYKLRADPARCS